MAHEWLMSCDNGWVVHYANRKDIDVLILTILTALPFYIQAAKKDPEDYRPHLNLSAVHFELGKYKQSIEYGQKALSTMNDEARQGISGERVSARIAKARVLLKDVDSLSTTGKSKGLDPRHLPRYRPTM
jgi:tetratricopeptide (TPR) repeat protein